MILIVSILIMATNGNNSKKILFVIRSGDIFPYFKSIIAALIEEGYAVRYLFDRKWSDIAETEDLLSRFKSEYPKFEYGPALQRNDWWRKILYHTRELSGYRMYLRSEQSPFYERRWLTYLPRTFQYLFTYKFFRLLLKSAIAGWFLRLFEKAAPAGKKISDQIRDFAPDAVVCNPTHARSSSADLEYLKAARALGIPTVIPVAGWDNLTTKGFMTVKPDLLLAWNHAHLKEAKNWHGIPEDRIKTIGAPLFDEWFAHDQPSVTRQEFCRQYGLRESDPIFLYLGSSSNMAENEVWLVERLHSVLRNSKNEKLNRTQFLVRPHPANYLNYAKIKTPGIIVAPKGALPKSKEVIQSFYDAVYYATAAIGINSSSMLMAIMAGKPVITVLTDKYRKTQEETQHFRQLMQDDVLDWASTDHEFVKTIERLLQGNDFRRNRRQKFVQEFLRPRGLSAVSGREAAQEIIALAQKSS